MFIEKYPDIVTVYKIGEVSKELCGGPHVNNTKELGTFKIKKEESSSSGIRRIKAVLNQARIIQSSVTLHIHSSLRLLKKTKCCIFVLQVICSLQLHIRFMLTISLI